MSLKVIKRVVNCLKTKMCTEVFKNTVQNKHVEMHLKINILKYI